MLCVVAILVVNMIGDDHPSENCSTCTFAILIFRVKERGKIIVHVLLLSMGFEHR